MSIPCLIQLNHSQQKRMQVLQPKLKLYGLYRALQSLKLYLISIRNLIIKVDARYIKGMLQSPDISPSAGINRWILAILMFHFTLVHVPGTHHIPNGLSRQKPQPGDKEEPEDNFEDWIDNINEFIHFLNPHPSISNYTTLSLLIALYVTSNLATTIDTPKVNQQKDNTTIPYSIIPRSDSAIEADRRLEKVQAWLETLDRPPGLTDSEYKTFMRYCMEFIIIGNQLWRKNP
jgi:hypothetical protein